MVVRLLLAVSILCLFSVGVKSAPKLELEITNKTVELGEAVVAELIGFDLTQSLSNIDLSPLESNFGVVVEETSSEYLETDSKRHLREVMLLKLYPRTLGKITVPALQLNTVLSPVTAVHVKPAMLHTKAISLDWKVNEYSPWERQQVVVQATVKTPERFAVLASDAVRIPGIELIRLPVEKNRLKDSTGGKTELTIGWVLFPHSSGIYTINLPVINYEVGGLVSRRFYLPQVTLNVKSLPPYIPPTMPVGKVDIRSELLSDSPLETNTLAKWVVSMQSAVLIPQWLPAVLRQVKSNNDFKIFPIESSRFTNPDTMGANGKVVHEIDFQPLRSGTIELPSIRIQYFDPDSERLVTLKTEDIKVYAVHPILIWLTKMVIISVLIFLAWVVIKRLIIFKQQRLETKQAIQIVAQADDINALRSGLKVYAKAMRWPENSTLSTWLACWQKQFDHNTELARLVQALSYACYNQDANIKVENLLEGFIAHLKSPSVVQVFNDFLSASLKKVQGYRM